MEWSDLSLWEADLVKQILLWANCPPFLDMCFGMLLKNFKNKTATEDITDDNSNYLKPEDKVFDKVIIN